MSASRLLLGFLAGFVSVLVFHQGLLALGTAANLLAANPWSMRPVPPFGVPQVVSAAFWGGLWGIVLAWVEPKLGRGPSYWLAVFVLGAVVLSASVWFIVQPLRGLPVGNGFRPSSVITGLLLHGVWAVGAALLLRLAPPQASGRRTRASVRG